MKHTHMDVELLLSVYQLTPFPSLLLLPSLHVCVYVCRSVASLMLELTLTIKMGYLSHTDTK